MILEHKGINIFYTDEGKGEAIVLLHGFLENSSMWQYLIPDLVEKNRVITIDLIGHGQTGCLGYIHTMEMMAEAVNKVISFLKIDKSVFIGHSMGGYVALAFIELYPDKPIYDIPALPVCTGESLTKNLLEQIKPFKTNFHLNERVQEISKEKNNWKIVTSKDKIFIAPNIIIAGGVGSFEPRKFLIKEAEKFENNGVYYSVKDKNYFKNKKVCIFGGGDSALDWAIELSNFSEVTLVHRRPEFRGAPSSLETVKKLEKIGKIRILTPYQLNSIEGDKNIKSVSLIKEDGKIEKLEIDYVLGFFGLIMKLGPIVNWDLNLDKKNLINRAINGEVLLINLNNFQCFYDL